MLKASKSLKTRHELGLVELSNSTLRAKSIASDSGFLDGLGGMNFLACPGRIERDIVTMWSTLIPHTRPQSGLASLRAQLSSMLTTKTAAGSARMTHAANFTCSDPSI